MPVRSLLRVFLAVLWLWPATALAQIEQWQSHMDAATTAYRQGNYPEAEKQLVAAVEEAERLAPPDLPVGVSIMALAGVYDAQGRYAEAEPLHKHSLAIRENALGSETPGVAQSLNNLAVLYEAQGKYAEAEPLYKRSLAIREEALGPEHPDVANSLENYGALLRKTGRGEEAEKLEARAKAIRAKHAKENPAK